MQTLNCDGTCAAHSCESPDTLTSAHVPRIGPEKGVIHIALGAVDNALWDMYARFRNKPLWKLVVDMSPVRSPLVCRGDSYP